MFLCWNRNPFALWPLSRQSADGFFSAYKDPGPDELSVSPLLEVTKENQIPRVELCKMKTHTVTRPDPLENIVSGPVSIVFDTVSQLLG